MLMIDYNQLNALRAVIRNGSFETAAIDLHVTPSAISQRIKSLEDHLGTTLVIRSTPSVATTAGRRLCRHADEVALLEHTLSHEMAGLVPTHTTPIRIVVNADSLDTWFIHAIAKSPDFLFDIKTDDQDFSADWLRRGEVLAAITAHATAVQGCDIIPLGSLRYLATASPGFQAKYFDGGFTLNAAKAAPMLMFNRKDDSQNLWLRSTFGKPVSPPVHYLPTTRGFVDAASQGVGWGLNPACLVHDKIASGELVTLSDNPVYDVPLFWQFNRVTANALRPLTDVVCAAAKLYLKQPV